MSQQAHQSVFQLGEAPWALPTTESIPRGVPSGVSASTNNGYSSHANGVPVPSTVGGVGLSALNETVLSLRSEEDYDSGSALPRTMSSPLTSPQMHGASVDVSTSGTAAGVLRIGRVGLAPSPNAIMLSGGITELPPEEPPSDAKVLGGGYHMDGDDGGVAALLATAAIDPGFHSEFIQGQNERDEQELGIDNWNMCKKYFYLGCLGLPLLHFVNVAYFVRQRRKGDRNVVLQTYALSSLLVAMFWVIVSVIWFLVYQFVLLDKFKWLGIQNVKLPPELI